MMCHAVRANRNSIFRCCSTTRYDIPTGAALARPLVSSHGRICTVKGHVSEGSNSQGYRSTTILGKHFFIHRLVAWAFLEPPPLGPAWQLNHIDGERSNNRACNLEYVTPAENISDSWRRTPVRKGVVTAIATPVLAKPLGADSWARYASIAEASRSLGLSSHSISSCCRGRRAHVGNYEFNYAERKDQLILPGEEWRPALHPARGAPLASLVVSSHGRVRSRRGIISLGSTVADGYRKVCVRENERMSSHLVHRVVARTFLGPCQFSSTWMVNHKDCNKANNHIDNLEYVTPSQNVQHYHRHRPSCRQSCAAALCKPVLGRRTGHAHWTRYASGKEAARVLGLHASDVSACCRGKREMTSQHEFQFVVQTFTSRDDEEWRSVDLLSLEVHSRILRAQF
ncbi:unnamed protein product [Prorocentrum cordatum]|uniref:HNH nuclease domain-containing protein n=1 Tax=Prorocentrum cordatum TaxID=2364126 RepID=A0ABN9R9Y2_9DINO|nr:unnamed protein product [Polarella glacialis]